MKQIILFSIMVVLATAFGWANTLPTDTTINYKNLKIEIDTQSVDKDIDISVYKLSDKGDSLYHKKIYEAIFTDTLESERQFGGFFEIHVPKVFQPKRKNLASAHMAGFGWSWYPLTNTISGNDNELNEWMDMGESTQFRLTPFQSTYKARNHRFSVMAGLGFEFNKINFQGNKYLAIDNYNTVFMTTPDNNAYKKSRLRLYYLTLPILMETNVPFFGDNTLWINGGVVPKFLLYDAVITKTMDGNQAKLKKELNTNPVMMDVMLQAGINDVGVVFTYSPFNSFRDGKGPSGKLATIGFQIYF